jgi:multidrug resistance efflux pump
VFVVSAPITGLMRRVDLEAGDEVKADDTIVARIEPSDPSFLDRRTSAEATAGVRTAQAARTHATAELRRVQAELEFAQAELTRYEGLAARHAISQNDLEAARRRARTADAALQESRAGVQVSESELEQARARLVTPGGRRDASADCECILVRSPVSGRVLRVLTESEGVVNSGAPLVEVGDPHRLEVVVDLLSTEAVKVEPGQAVLIESWGGPAPLQATVRRVEPFGYTKVSALGVEEQRVNVVIDLVDPPERWQRLGHGFRVEAIHGGMSQEQRERVMKNARGGQMDLLVATDVAARGIDIGHLSHVVNFGVPESPETYVHRIGRTGRAGREGVAITIAEPRERRLIRNIERVTRQPIAIEAVPSLSDVHARRLDLTRGAVREALEAGDYEAFRGMAESLAGEFEPLDVAAAALQLAHRAGGGDEQGASALAEEDIPDLSADTARERPARDARPERGARPSRGPRSDAAPWTAPDARRERVPRGADDGAERGPRQSLRQSAGMVRLRVSVGRRAGLRPGDLVGAIANESGVNVRAIGAIDLADHYSLVEVDEAVAERVAAALSRAWLRGQRPEVVRFDPGPTTLDMGLFDTLAEILREADPQGVPCPLLLSGATDGRFFSQLGIQTYGFLPMPLPEDFNFTHAVHANDERIPIEAVGFGTRAIYQALQRFGGSG